MYSKKVFKRKFIKKKKTFNCNKNIKHKISQHTEKKKIFRKCAEVKGLTFTEHLYRSQRTTPLVSLQQNVLMWVHHERTFNSLFKSCWQPVTRPHGRPVQTGRFCVQVYFTPEKLQRGKQTFSQTSASSKYWIDSTFLHVSWTPHQRSLQPGSLLRRRFTGRSWGWRLGDWFLLLLFHIFCSRFRFLLYLNWKINLHI